MAILLRWVLNAAALMLIAYLVPGFVVSSFLSALIAALVIGLVNALLRPILFILTLPIHFITLGLFSFVVDGLLIWLASTFVSGFTVEGFVPVLYAAFLMWIAGGLTSWLIKQGKNS